MEENKMMILDLNIEELENLMYELDFPKYRSKQLFEGLYQKNDINEIQTLPKSFKKEITDKYILGTSEIIKRQKSKDGTLKYLLKLHDGNVVESVLMKYKYGYSACISSQVGCRMGCKFCASTGLGLERNLSAGEMVGQIIAMQKDLGERINNIVVMGIGEPFDNFNNLVAFINLVHNEKGLNIGYRRITVSTCGIVPRIYDFAKEFKQVNLSVSLHAPDDATRTKIMPINKKYPIAMLMQACTDYIKITGRRITFEYALGQGINDSPKSGARLVALLRGMLCHVNLIPINETPGSKISKTTRKKVEDFKNYLLDKGITTTVRRELGSDIDAACGQLRKGDIGNKAKN